MLPSLHVWTILGRQGTRKGSLIRALTGIGREAHCDVLLNSGQYMRIWAAVSSANEPGDALSPKEWVAQNQPEMIPKHDGLVGNRVNVLVAFRLDRGWPGYEAEDYLNEISGAGTIESIVTLGETTRRWLIGYGVPYGEIADVNVPTAKIAERVRQFWGWR